MHRRDGHRQVHADEHAVQHQLRERAAAPQHAGGEAEGQHVRAEREQGAAEADHRGQRGVRRPDEQGELLPAHRRVHRPAV